MTAVIKGSGIALRDGLSLGVDNLGTVLMILDRTGEEAAPYLIGLRREDSRLTLYDRFPRENLEQLQYLTSFQGRRDAIRDYLIPALEDLPNWRDVVATLTRYALDRDDDSLKGRLSDVLEIILAFYFAAVSQPFDGAARAEAEYALSRLAESILKAAADDVLPDYLPFVERVLEFLVADPYRHAVNSFERRLLEVSGIKIAVKKRSEEVRNRLALLINRMYAQILFTTMGEIRACPDELVEKLKQVAGEEEFPEKDRFHQEIIDRIDKHSEEQVEHRKQSYQKALEGQTSLDESEISEGIAFVKVLAEDWRAVLAAFQDMSETLPARVQEAFAEILAMQILGIDKPEVKELLIEGLCLIVIRLEKTRKQASRDLVNTFAGLLLDRAYASQDVDEVVSSLKAVESLGVALGRANYSLMAQELIDHLVRRPLIPPRVTKYTVEDDDTGEPLVLAEEGESTRAHVQHIQSLMAIIGSNPRIMHRLMPYLIVQMEIGVVRLCDEDLIQYWISGLLRANSPVTHFLVRTLIKAIPYSFKDIGPLDTLRLTAASLAKELANRGVKPIGNFLGKLRGDIHWRGSIENFYFCIGIMKYFADGNREALAEWMPAESLPYLSMDQWCSDVEAQGIKDLCTQIFRDLGVDASEKAGLMALVDLDTRPYRSDDRWPEFSRRMVLDVVDLLEGLHTKYFISHGAGIETSEDSDLDRLEQVLAQRKDLKEEYLTPDIPTPLPPAVTLTEGSEETVREMDRLQREQPDAPIILRAKKAGHAYAQKATYIEPRFQAFTKDLTLEALQETLATSLNNTVFDAITPETLPQALEYLDQLVRGVSVNGHSSYYLEQAGRDLRRAGALGLTFDRVRDLLKIIKSELDDVHVFYRDRFEEPFDDFLTVCPMSKLPRKLKELTTLKDVPATDFFRNYLKTLYISDLQARDGNLRVLETFIDKVDLFLNQRLAESGRKVGRRGKGPARVRPFYFPDAEEISPCRIGLKASLLRFAENTSPYFVITTDQALKPTDQLLVDAGLRSGLSEAVEKLGNIWGRRFGNPDNPVLFSVRSGARVSMPGMMVTITNVGINDEIAESLAKKVDPWFAYDCYRRFLQEFSQSAFGVEREEFQDIIDESKAKLMVLRKADMSAEQMKTLAFLYKKRVAELAPTVVELLDQGRFLDILIHCAGVVMHSFESPAAVQYKQAAGIAGEWRTPVIVQTMVYGNMERKTSGTGVASYNPFTLDLRGDFAQGDQGTDVVNGKVATIPVYDPWKAKDCLASYMPEAWKQLSTILFRTAERLHLDTRLEYTIEKGKVFILQIRKDREKKERAPSLKSAGYRVIAQGTGVSGAIFRGIMVTDRNQIAPFRHINKAQSIIDAMNETLTERDKLDGFIFVVNDPIPEEIMQEVFSLPVATALVSRLGGRGAHAADISKSLKRVYVGQVRQIVKFAGRPERVWFQDMEVVVGSKMIIHGQTGEIGLYD
jgi:pyruvate,orthophosphate dikinase